MVENADGFTLSDGTVVTFTNRTDSPATEGFEIEMVVPPAARATPPHTHPMTDEFYVQEGHMEVLSQGNWVTLGPGDSLIVEPGQVHTYRNNFSAPCRLRNVHSPALSFQDYLTRMGRLASSGKLDDMSSFAALARMSILFDEHTDCMQFESLPLRMATKVIARVAKALGIQVPPA